MKDENGIRSVAAEMSDSGKKIIALINAIRSFLEELDDTHLVTFLADWPPANYRMRSGSARSFLAARGRQGGRQEYRVYG